MKIVEFNPHLNGNRFFIGQSDQEKAASDQLKFQKKYQTDLMGGKFDVPNRFDTYSDQFSYDDLSKTLEDVFGGYEDKINRQTNEAIAEAQGDAASRMASRGITGGSAVDDTLSGIASNINEKKFNALGDLGIGKAKSTGDLMNLFNQLKLNKTKVATDVDLANTGNKMSRIGQSSQQQQNLLGFLDDTTFIDDLFSGVSTVAGIAGIPTGKDSFLGKDIWKSIFG